MKILFAAGDFDKQLHAVNKIVLNIATQLCQRDLECVFTGISLFDNACEEQNGKLKTVRFNSSHPCDKAFLALENFVRISGLSREAAKKKFYFPGKDDGFDELRAISSFTGKDKKFFKTP